MSDYGMAAATRPQPSRRKDPSDVIDYQLSWQHLGSDTISTSTWESDGLTIGIDSIDGLTTSCFVSGGTAGGLYNLTNTVVTAAGRTQQRTVYVAVNDL